MIFVMFVYICIAYNEILLFLLLLLLVVVVVVVVVLDGMLDHPRGTLSILLGFSSREKSREKFLVRGTNTMHAETRTQTTDKSSTRYPPAARTQQEETSNAASNKPLPWNFSVYSVNVLPLSFT